MTRSLKKISTYALCKEFPKLYEAAVRSDDPGHEVNRDMMDAEQELARRGLVVVYDGNDFSHFVPSSYMSKCEDKERVEKDMKEFHSQPITGVGYYDTKCRFHQIYPKPVQIGIVERIKNMFR